MATTSDESAIKLGQLKTFLAKCKDRFAGKSEASTTAAGLMSATDKAKLDGIAEGANKYELPQSTSTVLGGVRLNPDNFTTKFGGLELNYKKLEVDTSGVDSHVTISSLDLFVIGGAIKSLSIEFSILELDSTSGADLFTLPDKAIPQTLATQQGSQSELIFDTSCNTKTSTLFPLVRIDSDGNVSIIQRSTRTTSLPNASLSVVYF